MESIEDIRSIRAWELAASRALNSLPCLDMYLGYNCPVGGNTKVIPQYVPLSQLIQQLYHYKMAIKLTPDASN